MDILLVFARSGFESRCELLKDTVGCYSQTFHVIIKEYIAYMDILGVFAMPGFFN